MSKKTAQFVEYNGAVYRIAGGLGTTQQDTNVSLFDSDFDSEGELQYSGTPEGGQFFFESRVKFPDGTLLPISMQIDEDSAVEIVRKMGGGTQAQSFPDKWRSRLPDSFLQRVSDQEQKALPEGEERPRELKASTEAKEITATILPWRTIPESTVSQISLRLGAAGEDKPMVGALGGRVQRMLMRRYYNARVSVKVDGGKRSDAALISVRDASGEATAEHDGKIEQLVSDIWQKLQQEKK